MRVLVVDHNRDDLDRMDQILENQAGIDYRLCDRPDQALTLLNKGEIDCLLLDIHMPAMDGLQMIQKVRELQGGTWLPTLFMASAEDVKSRGRALRGRRRQLGRQPDQPDGTHDYVVPWGGNWRPSDRDVLADLPDGVGRLIHYRLLFGECCD